MGLDHSSRQDGVETHGHWVNTPVLKHCGNKRYILKHFSLNPCIVLEHFNYTFLIYNNKCSIPHHHVDVAYKAPECSALVLCDIENGRQQIAHALHIAQVEVVHDVAHKDVVEQVNVWVVLTLIKWMTSVCSVDVLL